MVNARIEMALGGQWWWDFDPRGENNVALAGKLEDVQPAEILHFLAMSEKTGKLSFTTGTQEGLIVFRDGKIIYAASSSLRETFGSITLNLGIVSQSDLEAALLQQHRSGEDKRLGEILVEAGTLAPADLQRVLHHQVIQVLREMFGWNHGFFRFRALELDDFGDVEVDYRDLIVATPLDARSVALDAARRHDEASRGRGDADGSSGLTESDDEEEQPPERASVAEMMGDVVAPSVTAEIVRAIFDAAAKVFSRGVVFAVHSQSVRGMAQFGLTEGDDPPSQRVRGLWLPVDEPSIVAQVAVSQNPFRGNVERNRWNETLVQDLGGEWPDEAVALPVVVGGRTVLVFYGDNEPDDLPVGSISDLQKLLVEVSQDLARSVE